MKWKTHAEAYRAQARHCQEVARIMSTAEGKREFEKLAHGWLTMAERAEAEEQHRNTVERVSNQSNRFAWYVGKMNR